MKSVWWWEKLRRGVRTVYFMVVMVASLLVMSLPLVVAISDAVLPCLLISSFTCVKCYSVREHLQIYAFRSSLMDIPVVSIIRSFIIICMSLSLFAIPLSLCLSPILPVNWSEVHIVVHYKPAKML